MKPITAIVLVGVLVAFILFALFTGDLFSPSKPEEQKVTSKKLYDPAPGKPVEVTVESAGGKFVFKKVDDQWRIVEPIQAKAEDWRVNEVADAVKDLKGRPAEGVSDETTGLGKPRWAVTMVDDKKASFRVLVGRARPMESNETYVRLPTGNKTFIAEVDFAYKLDKPLSDFRDETVLDIKSDKIAHLQIEGKDSYELRKTDGKWGLVKPISTEADTDEVKKLLDKVARVTASEFVADAPKDLAAYGLTQPRLRVRIEMQPEKPAATPTTASTKPAPKPNPGKQYAFRIGKEVGDKLYAKLENEPAVFKVDRSLLTDLQPKLIDLRAKKVMRLTADEVAAVEIEVPAGKASLVKTDGQWQMTAPLKGKADNDKVKALLDAAAGLKADSFEDSAELLKPYGLDAPKAKVTFRLAGKGEKVTLLIGGETASGEMTFVKSEAALAVAVVKKSDVKALLGEPASYWDRTLLKLGDHEKVTRLELRRTDDTFVLAPDANDTWSLTAPLKAPADIDHVNKVIDHLEDLSAEKVVSLASEAPETYTKASDIMQVILTTQETPPEPATKPTTQPTQPATGPATQATKPAATQPTQPAKPKPKPVVRTLTVAKVSLHSYAWLSGGKIVAVGEFAPSLYDDLAGELRSRKVWAIDPDKVRAIQLTAGSDSVELKKEDDAWKYTKDTYVKIDPDKVTDFLKDIKDLTAKKYATNKAPKDPAKYGLDKPWLKMTLTDEKGAKTSIVLSHTGSTKTEDRYGTASTAQGVFELEASTIEKMSKSLKDFKK